MGATEDGRSPLVLETLGGFCVGDEHNVDRAHVRYAVPAGVRGLPVVLVHGGGLAGSVWETTPDGREGWYPRFLRGGWATFVPDLAPRGQADPAPVLRTEAEAWDVFRIGTPEGYATRTAYPGQLFPVAALDELTGQLVPRWTTTADAAVAALAALVRRLGRCVLVAHGQGGGVAARVAQEERDGVAGLVLLEPYGLPNPRHSPLPLPHLLVSGDYLLETNLYRELESRWQEYRQNALVAGHRVDRLDLPQRGVTGNSHMLMMDANSDAIADLVQQWIGDRVL